MNAREALFTHSVARFRSSIPLPTLQLWSHRHGYDLALALAEAALRILERPVTFVVLTHKPAEGESDLFVAVEIDGAPFDIYGSNVQMRIEEAIFDDVGEVGQERAAAADQLFSLLDRHDFFFSYWPPEPDFHAAIREGILCAAQELEKS